MIFSLLTVRLTCEWPLASTHWLMSMRHQAGIHDIMQGYMTSCRDTWHHAGIHDSKPTIHADWTCRGVLGVGSSSPTQHDRDVVWFDIWRTFSYVLFTGLFKSWYASTITNIFVVYFKVYICRQLITANVRLLFWCFKSRILRLQVKYTFIFIRWIDK